MTLLLHIKAARLSEFLAHGLVAALAVWAAAVAFCPQPPSTICALTIATSFLAFGAILGRQQANGHPRRVIGPHLLLLALAVGLAATLLLERGLLGHSFPPPFGLGLGFLVGALALLCSSRARGFGISGLLRPSLSGGRVLIVGNNRRTRHLLEHWQAQAFSTVKRIGWVDVLDDIDPARRNPCQDQLPLLGDVSEIDTILRDVVVDEVWVTLPVKSRYREIEKIIRACETVGVAVRLPADTFERRDLPIRASDGQHVGDLYYQTVPGASWQFLLKRCLDVAASLVLLVLAAPAMLLIALLIKLTSPGPVLYSQERCGLHGRRFEMYKFRSMVDGADDLKEQLRDQNEVSGPVFKIAKDPRITKVGHILRRTSLDELPQIFNILKGDMSLVGPRPPVPSEVAEYEPWQLRRLSVLPGITCIWQVSGRSNIAFDDWMRMDLDYIRTWSVTKDLRLLFRTVPAVLSRRGAA